MWVVIRNDELSTQAVVHTDALEHHINRGWVRVSEPAADKDSLHPQEYADAPDLDAEPDEETAVRPPKSAVKADWVAHAVDRGADPERAEHATKDQLVEAYGPDGTGSLPDEDSAAKANTDSETE